MKENGFEVTERRRFWRLFRISSFTSLSVFTSKKLAVASVATTVDVVVVV